MKVFIALLASVWLAVHAMGGAQAESFTVAGFQRNMDLAGLLDRYPQSSHDVTPGGGVRRRTSQDDEKSWMREFFHSGGSGTYVLRLTPAESHDHVYYVQATIHDGVTERLSALFELPLELMKRPTATNANEARHPACHGVLSALEARYGRPAALPARWEEAVEWFDYKWSDPSELMTLECGRYQGRKAVLAMGVTIEKASGTR